MQLPLKGYCTDYYKITNEQHVFRIISFACIFVRTVKKAMMLCTLGEIYFYQRREDQGVEAEEL